MTDYVSVSVPDTFYVKSPITFELMQLLYENPKAIAEGAVGAPRVAIDVGGQTAIATDETDTSTVLRPDGLGGVEWGSEQAQNPPRFSRYNMLSNSAGSVVGTSSGVGSTGTTYQSHEITYSGGTFTVHSDGSYTASAVLLASGANMTGYWRKNGSTIAGGSFGNGAFDNGKYNCVTINIDLNAGDTLQFYHLTGGGAFDTLGGYVSIVRV